LNWYPFFIVVALVYSYHIFKKDKLVAATFCYVFFQCLYVAAYKLNRYAIGNGIFDEQEEILRIVITSNSYCFMVLAIVCTQFYLNGSWRDIVFKAFAWLAPINSVIVIAQKIFNQIPNEMHAPSGVIYYPSINGSLIACLIPLVFSLPYGWFFSILCLVGIVLCGSSMPYITLAVVLAFWAFSKTKKWWALGVMSFPILLGLLFEKQAMFSSSRRFEAYKFFMRDWLSNFSIWWGSGPGTFIVLGPRHQLEKEYSIGEWWYWLHSDWLELLYEFGIWGLLLGAAIYLRALYRHYKTEQHDLFGVLAGIGVTALFNFPMPHAIFMVLTIAVLPLFQKKS